jgi:rhamnulokinase
MVQAKAAGAVADIWDMRRIIADSIHLERYLPEEKDLWEAAYKKYIAIVTKR